MKYLVTGGAGGVGVYIVKLLAEMGHEVTAAGRHKDREVPGAAHYCSVDMTDFDAVRELVAWQDRVIHLAAIPAPGRIPGHDIFHINCQGTYNVLEACALAGIDHVSIASSINALGQKYGTQPWPVHYFPIDEDHPVMASDPYSLSKEVTEDIARYFWRKNGLSSICLRIPGVFPPRESVVNMMRAERAAQGQFNVTDFWVMIDSRDSARAFVRAADPCYTGAHVCFVNDTVNLCGLPSRELAARWYPYVTEWRAPIKTMTRWSVPTVSAGSWVGNRRTAGAAWPRAVRCPSERRFDR